MSSRSGIMIAVIGLLLLTGCASKRVYRDAPPAADAAEDDAVRQERADEDGERPTSSPPQRPTTPSDAVMLGIRVANVAHDQVGRPYRWGGENPGEGFDCSGLVHWSYGCVGVGVPRVVRRQRQWGVGITGDRLQPGDLVFFAVDGRSTSHVAIYVGDGRFVHAPGSGQAVRVDSLDDSWWRERWTDSRRFLTR